jgi:hemerythrin
MGIEWTANLSTGIGWQDKHHKELFKRINRLLDAMTLGHGKEEVGSLFKFLDDYIVYHFEAEEQAMARHGYEGALAHTAEHTHFIDDIAALRDEFGKGSSSSLVIKVQRQVVDWLLNHICGPDKKLGAFLRTVQGGEKAG